MINIRVAEVMGRRRLSKKALADVTDIRPATIGMLWHGTSKRIDIEYLDRLCRVLQCQPGDLFEYIPDEEADRK